MSLLLDCLPSLYQLCTLISAIYLIKNKSESSRSILGYVVLIIFIIFNPFITNYLVSIWGWEGRIGRFSSCAPCVAVITIFVIDLITIKGKSFVSWIIVCGIGIVIISVGNEGYHFYQYENETFYKLTNEEIEIGNCITDDSGMKKVIVYNGEVQSEVNLGTQLGNELMRLHELRQMFPNITSWEIEQYIYGGGKSSKEIYGTDYGDYYNLVSLSKDNRNLEYVKFIKILDGLDVEYCIMLKNSHYLENYYDCILTTDHYMVLKRV